MESSEIKSKKLAFSLTLGLHGLLLLFFLLTGFVSQERSAPVAVCDAAGEELAGFNFTLEEPVAEPEASSAEKFVSDPYENNYIVEPGKALAYEKTAASDGKSEFEKAFEKMRHLKNLGKPTDGSDNGSSEVFGNKENSGTLEDGEESSFFLKDRSLLRRPSKMSNESEEGKVIVEIIVNAEGKVIAAVAGQRGSTTTNRELNEKAVQAALSAKFSPSKEGVEEQRGTYTFVFTLE